MKLQTNIPPRKDGTVRELGLDGKTYIFKMDEYGEMVGDVDHAPTVAKLLRTQFYTPLDDVDFVEATGLATASEDDPDVNDDAADLNALPLEANTPPKPARAKPGPKPKAKA